MRYALLSCALLLLAAGCSFKDKPQGPPQYHAELYVRFLAPEQLLSAQAHFYALESGKNARAIQLEKGAAFNGSGMEFRNPAPQFMRYHYEQRTGFPAELRFSFSAPDADKPTEVALA